MKRVRDWYGQLPPSVRFAGRTFAIAVATYAYKAQSDGSFSLDALLDTAKIAGSYALLGLLTPLEPFVGVGKPDVVAVPSPPAVDEDSL